ncbi:hypothetical protein HIM_11265 [Hirsutella minnesotensis 3608]|uniref:Endonuclease/exonuclease/phosphatase domain-containing protein n=1 Tax=Hirsutella minnesotensis 3608 TaxID=1043627 RepID=A0A0F7ZRB9_9HYPO|nr:hypothetical protein HIM_11265 [Hirsutella minnesotensis 3608]
MKAFVTLLLAAGPAAAETIAEINGPRFLSPFDGRDVRNVTGFVTAAADSGVYLRNNKPDKDAATSEGLYVYGTTIVDKVQVGDLISLDGKVKEYRSNEAFIPLTELTEPSNIVVLSSSNEVKPLVIGRDTPSPPGRDFSSLDKGGVFGVPNAVDSISKANPRLNPASYGLDFWESLVGELVTVTGAISVGRPNRYGDVWVRGSGWNVTSVNGHGGVTMLEGVANPETILVGAPLDGTKNSNGTKMGDALGDVTGVISNAFGFYRLLPLKQVSPSKSGDSVDYPPTKLVGGTGCEAISVAGYNVENLSPKSKHLGRIVDHIVTKLKTPGLLFLQEIQDNSGPTDDGVVSANVTLATLADGIRKASGVSYEWTDIDPVDGQDGGQPGGNIRCAYMYRPDVVRLHQPRPGGSEEANSVLDGPKLALNPGRIDPGNAAFEASRKPLAAMWTTVKGGDKSVFFTVNVHFGSKGGSTSLHGDARPPVNKGVEKRLAQTTITADFVAQILSRDAQARVIVAGDFNEFAQVEPQRVFASRSGLVEADEAAGLSPVERYTYLFDMNSESLDHIYLSRAASKGVRVEHLHLNTWQPTKGMTSDHDPSVAQLNLCGAA